MVKYFLIRELEKLQKKKIKKFEVHNCGQGGYNSADILVHALQIVDFQPDIIFYTMLIMI